MIKIVVLICTVLLSSSLFAQNLMWKTRDLPDGITIIYQFDKGFDDLKNAIDSVPKNSWIKHIAVSNILNENKFQDEIFSYLQIHYPTKLKTALLSAGNMHNPAIIQIRDAYMEAILKSERVQTFNSKFSARCERITNVSIEKLFISKSSGEPRFSSFLWLTTDECT
ncbi:hypothetical protein PN836_018770 [Ningiella sp. W23]|uniref:hypothetical protein n=1 Tax=Ningiella sp. W23 TaxID=3023715 RepID=UPI0037570479